MDSRYCSQNSVSQDLISEEKNQLDSMFEELESTYTDFISELDNLWEETKDKIQTACKEMLTGQQAQLERLQEAKAQSQNIASQLQRTQEFFQHVSHLLPNRH